MVTLFLSDCVAQLYLGYIQCKQNIQQVKYLQDTWDSLKPGTQQSLYLYKPAAQVKQVYGSTIKMLTKIILHWHI